MRRLLSYRSTFDLVWLWHATFDGTRLCPCPHSRWYAGEISTEELNRLER